MLCTQASYAFSFLLMHNYYNDNFKGLHVISKTTISDINIDPSNNNISIQLKATYNLININNGAKRANINVVTKIDIIDTKFCKYGMILWNYESRQTYTNLL